MQRSRGPEGGLSVVVCGRNDGYGGDFRGRSLAAFARNAREVALRGLDVEWIFVEWNPCEGELLSHLLAPLGFRCWVVPPQIHRALCGNPRMPFMQSFAKNVGIRRSTRSWILDTNPDCVLGSDALDHIAETPLDPHVLYRAERRDVDPALFSAPFEEMAAKTVRVHATRGGAHYGQAAGDFMLYHRGACDFGYDEEIDLCDIHMDSRFMENFRLSRPPAQRSDPRRCFEFIGTVFKADHPGIYARTSGTGRNAFADWPYLDGLPYTGAATSAGAGESSRDWGLADCAERELAPNVRQVEPLAETISSLPTAPSGAQPVACDAGTKLTLIGVPEPLEGAAHPRQDTALTSWTRLAPDVGTLLLGGELERHAATGRPLVPDLLARARALASSPFIGFARTDLVLGHDLVSALDQLIDAFGRFIAVGQSWDLEGDWEGATERSEADPRGWRERLLARVDLHGTLQPPTSIDLIIWPHEFVPELPRFQHDCMGWRNYLLRAALDSDFPVVDVSPVVRAVRLAPIDQGRAERLQLGDTKYGGLITRAPYELTQSGVEERKTVGPREEATNTLVQQTRAIFCEGVESGRAGRNEEALQLFDRTSRRAPGLPDLHLFRAAVLVELGRTVEARAALQAELDLQPDHSGARALLRELGSRGRTTSLGSGDPVAIAIVAVPKPFHGHTGRIQYNAIVSWTQLRPRPDILLLGSDEGTAEAAAELGVRHEPDLRCSPQGTPMLRSVFERAHASTRAPTLVYVNADILLLDDFPAALARLARSFERFLAIGQRWDLDVLEPLPIDETDWRAGLRARVKREAILHDHSGIDYFAFSRGLWPELPDFVLGRMAWDNWLVRAAIEQGTAVIDASPAITAVHQNHDYGHVALGGARSGPEYEHNRRLAGPLRDDGGCASDAPWELGPDGLRERRPGPEGLTPNSMLEATRTLFRQGVERAGGGDLRGALDSFSATLRRSPGSKHVHYFRAAVLQQLGRREQALADARAELTIQPDHAEARALVHELELSPV